MSSSALLESRLEKIGSCRTRPASRAAHHQRVVHRTHARHPPGRRIGQFAPSRVGHSAAQADLALPRHDVDLAARERAAAGIGELQPRAQRGIVHLAPMGHRRRQRIAGVAADIGLGHRIVFPAQGAGQHDDGASASMQPPPSRFAVPHAHLPCVPGESVGSGASTVPASPPPRRP
ncbi:hypothetical protein BGLA2_3330003 [Burkholderia gladioli]|nr:hypothetical protein BGLA2_3330003 [Burkholderia gladioli]